jgi:hypothetical protein
MEVQSFQLPTGSALHQMFPLVLLTHTRVWSIVMILVAAGEEVDSASGGAPPRVLRLGCSSQTIPRPRAKADGPCLGQRG